MYLKKCLAYSAVGRSTPFLCMRIAALDTLKFDREELLRNVAE